MSDDFEEELEVELADMTMSASAGSLQTIDDAAADIIAAQSAVDFANEAQHLAERFSPGDQVTWRHEMRGGYGYVERVPGEIVSITSARIAIRVHLKGGAEVVRYVRPDHLVRASQ